MSVTEGEKDKESRKGGRRCGVRTGFTIGVSSQYFLGATHFLGAVRGRELFLVLVLLAGAAHEER
jgi:hypothetical protein